MLQKLKSLLAAVTLIAAITPSHAYTVDEIIANSEHMVCLYKYSGWRKGGTNSYNTYPYYYGATNGETIKLTKLSDKEILFSGFYGTLDLVGVLYSSSTKKIDSNGDEIRFYRYKPSATILNGLSDIAVRNVNGTTAFGKDKWNFHLYNMNKYEASNPYYWLCWTGQESSYTSGTTYIALKIKKDNNGLYFLTDHMTPSGTGKGYVMTLCVNTGTISTSKPSNETYATDKLNGASLVSAVGAAAYHPARFIDYMEFVPIRDFNMVVNEKYTHYKYHTTNLEQLQTVEREYGVGLDIDESAKTFTIRNFSNLGFAYSHSNSNSATTFYYPWRTTLNGTYTPSYSVSGSFSRNSAPELTFGHENEDYVTGTIDANGNLIIDRTKIVRNALLIASFSNSYSTAYNYWNLNWHDMRPTYFVDNGDRSTYDGTKEIIGNIINIEKGIPEHNRVENHWVSNGGIKKTYDDGQIVEFSPYTYVASTVSNNRINYTTNLNGDLNFVDSYTGTTMYSKDGECTNQVELTVSEFRYNASDDENEVVLAVLGDMETKAHDQYVDHYEIMVAPGRYSRIDDSGFVYDATAGIQSGIVISKDQNDNSNFWWGTDDDEINQPSDISTMSVDNTKDYSLRKAFTRKDLGGAYSPDGKYTFYIKTVYKDGLGLEPTFHSMVSPVADKPTSIDKVFADANDDFNVEPVYYNMQGVKVDADNMVPGIYVKRCGKSAEKVLIR